MVLKILCALIVVCAVVVPTVAQLAHKWKTNDPIRLQWFQNDGYCGEMSLIMAGLKYGQYISQYDARVKGAVAAPQTGKTIQKSQLLLGMNEKAFAQSLKVSSISFPADVAALGPPSSCTGASCNPPASVFLAWVKKMVRLKYSVSFAVYENFPYVSPPLSVIPQSSCSLSLTAIPISRTFHVPCIPSGEWSLTWNGCCCIYLSSEDDSHKSRFKCPYCVTCLCWTGRI